MRPVSPNTGADEHVFAEGQTEYAPISYAVYAGPQESVGLLSRWRLNDEDRHRIAAGEDLYICLLTGGNPQPIIVQIGPDGWLVPSVPPTPSGATNE